MWNKQAKGAPRRSFAAQAMVRLPNAFVTAREFVTDGGRGGKVRQQTEAERGRNVAFERRFGHLLGRERGAFWHDGYAQETFAHKHIAAKYFGILRHAGGQIKSTTTVSLHECRYD